MAENNILVIELPTRSVKLILPEFDMDMDVDDILKIDYSNIIGELLTFPVIMNRIGVLKAEQEDVVRKSKFKLEIYEAQLRHQFYRTLATTVITSTGINKGIEKLKAPTEDQVTSKVLMDKTYQEKQEFHSQRMKDFSLLESWYWAAKSKDDNLKRISMHLKPEEFEKEILEGTVNGIMIKFTKINPVFARSEYEPQIKPTIIDKKKK